MFYKYNIYFVNKNILQAIYHSLSYSILKPLPPY